ncbi:MAG TPA: tripartite tricarboxylate transporter substrate binding protein [Xanthobacteraceae bacterium]|nr:tripartite tricarboxylate transporter substrate binding protein [Xanthobacteraceae bacterium]
MTMPHRRFLLTAGAAACAAAFGPSAGAQTYPARPVRIIIATTAGGSTDIAARLIAQWLTEKLGQSFVVENRPGGNNNVGTEYAAHAPADGYTLFMANSVNSINAVLYTKLGYDFVTDFIPIVHFMRSPILFMVHPAVPAKTVPEFIAYAKANPNKISMASGGSGSSGHLAGELFMMRTGVKLIHVPYRGESVAMTDVLAGQPQVVFATSGSSIAFVKSGAVRALAVTSTSRIEQLPDVPAMAEFLPGYEASGWSGLCAPKNTSAAIVALLNKQVNDALATAAIRNKIATMGGVAPGGSSADFAKYIGDEVRKWKDVVAFAGIKVE